jgi:DNA-binding MarR family transcriptional regulator
LKDPKIRSVGWLLTQAARLHRSYLNEQLADHRLYAGQEQVFRVLLAAGALTVGELAQNLRVQAPTVSKSLNRLSAAGLIERETGAGDLRIVMVRLSPRGQALAASVNALWDQVEEGLLKGFNDQDRRQLRKLLNRINDNFNRFMGSPE